jgi:hypothetical protein
MNEQTSIAQGAAASEDRKIRARGRRSRRLLRLDNSLDRHLRTVWRTESKAWRETVLTVLNDAPPGGRFIEHVALHPDLGVTAAHVRFSDSSRIVVGNCHPPAVLEIAQWVLREEVRLSRAHYPGPFYALDFSGSEGPFSLLVGKVLLTC